MASDLRNLSDLDLSDIPGLSEHTFAIIVSTYYSNITEKLYEGAVETLTALEVPIEKIKRIEVPGSFELTAGAMLAAERLRLDAVICLGCVIKGETDHDQYINQAIADGLTALTIQYKMPFIFGLLTTNDEEQAIARAGGDKGNKGSEAAAAAAKMIAIQKTQFHSKKAGFNR